MKVVFIQPMFKNTLPAKLSIFLIDIQQITMISSSNFFRKTLFHSQQKQKHEQKLPSLRKDSIAPWQAQEDLSFNFLAQQKQPQEKVRKKAKKKQVSIPKLPSNLLNVETASPQSASKVSPSATVLKRVPINVKCKIEDSRNKIDPAYDSMSIREFLSQQRVELMRLKQANRQTIEAEYQPNHFFVNRNSRKTRSIDAHNKTLDLRRQLLQPLQVFERKSVIAINPSLKKRKLESYMATAQKYNPLYQHRYSFV